MPEAVMAIWIMKDDRSSRAMAHGFPSLIITSRYDRRLPITPYSVSSMQNFNRNPAVTAFTHLSNCGQKGMVNTMFSPHRTVKIAQVGEGLKA
jgi:hypothetical protein